MRILLYGENWEGTHVNCISRVLSEFKIDHKIFDFYSILNPQIKYEFANKIIRKLMYSQNESNINSLLISEIDLFKPDVLFISKGVNIYPETLKLFKDKSIKIANWNPDDFFNNLNSSKYLLNSLDLYDFVFSARKHLFDEYKFRGIKDPVYLEWYYIPWLHKKTNNILEIQRKITFIGTYSKRREEIINSINVDCPIEIWGAGWNFSSLRFKKNLTLKNSVLTQSQFPEIISSSLINLNILTLENRDCTNLKLFEISASNGLLLTEENEASKEILGNSCVYYNFNDPMSLNKNIEDILDEDKFEHYNELRNSGYLNIMASGNSIRDRVYEIVDILR